MITMRRQLLVVLVVVAAASCSKQREAPGSGGSGTAAAPAADPGAAAGAGAAKPAPAMTPELFVTEPTKFTIEALDRGLWINEHGGAFQHKCRVELGMTMARAGKLRGAAMEARDNVTCEPKGSYTVCAFALPDADPANPDSRASWVFTADDDSDETVLIAVLFGTYDWAKIEPALPPKQACPRPSADPR